MHRLISGLVLAMLFGAQANAATVSILAPEKVLVGETFKLSIFGDFGTDGLIAGGLQMLYDPSLLQINSFLFTLNIDPSLSCPGAGSCPVDPPGTFSIVWGQFLTDLIPAGAGPTEMATLQVTALAPSLGTTALTAINFTDFTGGWFGAGFVFIPTPEFLGTGVEINVPLPAAMWFMIGGLGTLLGFRRR